jgi:hypothetical protein
MYDAPISPVRLPGTLWGIAAYFNPVGYKSRLKNFRIFGDRIRRQCLPLIVVEAAFGDAPFELDEDDADFILRLRTHSILWQKERLLNLACSLLPVDCDKVVALDTDVCFLRDDWPTVLSSALERYVVVQPYRKALHPSQGVAPENADVAGGEWAFSTAYSCALNEHRTVQNISGHPGYAVAFRRSVLDACGFYEYMILGGGDSLLLGACYGLDLVRNDFISGMQKSIGSHCTPWYERISAQVRGSVGSIEGDVIHLWHGDRRERFYHERPILLAAFNPSRDISAAPGCCLEWTAGADRSLRDAVARYFLLRNEDGILDTSHHPDLSALQQALLQKRAQEHRF